MDTDVDMGLDLSLSEETYEGVENLIERLNDHIEAAEAEEGVIDDDGYCQWCGTWHWDALDGHPSFIHIGQSGHQDEVYLGPEGTFVAWISHYGRYGVIRLWSNQAKATVFDAIRSATDRLDKDDLVEILDALLDELE